MKHMLQICCKNNNIYKEFPIGSSLLDIYYMRNTIITIIAVIATAKVMGYSGMTSDIARTAVEATGMMYPAIAPLFEGTTILNSNIFLFIQ